MDRKNRRLDQSFADAARGLWFCIRSERNMRIHLTAAFYVVAAGILGGVSPAQWAAIMLCFALVISLELVNTAIEKLCDRVCCDYDEPIGRVKDISAAAVLIAAVFSVAVAVFIFIVDKKALGLIDAICDSPALGVAVVLTLPLALIFIFKAGKKR